MTYTSPFTAIMHAMRTAGQLDHVRYPDLSVADAEAILGEAGKFAEGQIAPLNQPGDQQGAVYADGTVTTPEGWKTTYRNWTDAGWNSLAGPAAFGGQDLPMIMAVACAELWNSASIAFAVNPLLTAGAIEAIAAHASADLKDRYLPHLVSGRWTGTMNLTEPQSGSDLSALRCKATRHADGTYRIEGTKIYITYGEHDCADNIIHLVLARLNDAPGGTRGISLFLVPKILPDGTRNDLRCTAIEHKLGLRASPTCTMIYGDTGGATGWLIGEENRGLTCMFTMMNNARLLVGTQGVAIAERATQAAVAFAAQRRQGKAPGSGQNPSPIIAHPDVKRMLLDMRTKTAAARLLCMATASAIDASTRGHDQLSRQVAQARASLLTPLAKSYATDIAVEVASVGIQVHGGMGFIEETGVAQHYRDARILPIYEGTNGIQAIDLVTRKLMLDNGAALTFELQRCRASIARAHQAFALKDPIDTMNAALASLEHCAATFADAELSDLLAGASPFLRALSVTLAAGYLLDVAVHIKQTAPPDTAPTDACYYIATEVAVVPAMCNWASRSGALIQGAVF